MIPRSNNSVSIILLVQFFVIIAGTLIVTGMLKANGYPGDTGSLRWGSTAVFIRNWGMWALLIPVISFFFMLRQLKLNRGENPSPTHLLLVISVTIGLLMLYAWSAIIGSAPIIIRINNLG